MCDAKENHGSCGDSVHVLSLGFGCRLTRYLHVASSKWNTPFGIFLRYSLYLKNGIHHCFYWMVVKIFSSTRRTNEVMCVSDVAAGCQTLLTVHAESKTKKTVAL